MRDILQTADGDIDFTATTLFWPRPSGRPASTSGTFCSPLRVTLRRRPTLGVAAVEYIQDDAELFLRNVRKQMQEDGMNITRVAFNGTGELIIEGGYSSEND